MAFFIVVKLNFKIKMEHKSYILIKNRTHPLNLQNFYKNKFHLISIL
ncbi:hypothetical protein EMIT0210MI2_80007 [Priestia megaterium]